MKVQQPSQGGSKPSSGSGRPRPFFVAVSQLLNDMAFCPSRCNVGIARGTEADGDHQAFG